MAEVSLLFAPGEQILDAHGKLTFSAAAKLNRLAQAVVAAPDTYVAKDTVTDWTAWTGTADRATHATYTAATISNPPTQAEVQAIANAVQNVSRGFKAKLDDDIASGVNK